MIRLLTAAIGLVIAAACGPAGRHAGPPPNADQTRPDVSGRGGIVRLFASDPDTSATHPPDSAARPFAGHWIEAGSPAALPATPPARDSLSIGA